MILITGATGGLGEATINALLKITPLSTIVALVRNKDKAAELEAKGIQVRMGDYDNYTSLVKAFEGIDKILAISAAAFSNRALQEINVINAAVQAGVKQLFFTSIQRNDTNNWVIPYVTEANLEVEKYLEGSGLIYTILKNTLYADTLPFLLGQNAVNDGIRFPAGKGKVAFATREDLGEGIARLLLSDDYQNQAITLSNSRSWSFEDVAKELSILALKPVAYHDVSKEEYVTLRTGQGVPPIAAKFGADWAEASKQGEFIEASPILEKLLGRKPETIKTYLKKAFFGN